MQVQQLIQKSPQVFHALKAIMHTLTKSSSGASVRRGVWLKSVKTEPQVILDGWQPSPSPRPLLRQYRSWAELGRRAGAGPARRRRDDVRARGRPTRRPAHSWAGGGCCRWLRAAGAAGSASTPSALRHSPGPGLRGPAPARHGAVGEPCAAPLSLRAAASPARGHHAYPWVSGRGSGRAGGVGKRRPARRALRGARCGGGEAGPGRGEPGSARDPLSYFRFGLAFPRGGVSPLHRRGNWGPSVKDARLVSGRAGVT